MTQVLSFHRETPITIQLSSTADLGGDEYLAADTPSSMQIVVNLDTHTANTNTAPLRRTKKTKQTTTLQHILTI